MAGTAAQAAPTQRAPITVTVTPEGLVTAIVAVTGVTDQVNDVIVPGAFTRTLAIRRPKVVFHHDWKMFLGRVLHIEEWLPGDKRLPATTKDGKAWPAGAGALVATMQFNMATEAGRTGWEWVRFYSESNECEFSIGYKVVEGRTAKRRDGARIIYDLDVFELSLVLFGAASQTMTLEVKGIDIRGLEHKNVALSAVIGDGPAMRALLEAKDANPDPTPSAGPSVAGLAVLAADTGRVLMLQRALTHNDPAAGTWEFPGGHLDDGEDPAGGAIREWAEETGLSLPAGDLADCYDSPNGVYRLHAYVVPIESAVTLNPDQEARATTNPDDPNGLMPEVSAWWDLRHAQSNPALRPEVQANTDWTALAGLVGGKVSDDLETKTAAHAVLEAKGLAGPQAGETSTCPCGTPVVFDPANGWQHADGSISHPDGQSVSEKMPPVVEYKHDYSPIGTPGGKPNWVDEVNGLPLYIRDVAHALIRHGHDTSQAIAMAVGSMKRWAAGGDNVTPETQARASAALAEWERKRAQAHATPTMETKSMDMPGSYEERRDALSRAVRDQFCKDDTDSDGDCASWACIEATYDTYVIATVNDDDGSRSFQVPYSFTDGQVELGTAEPVTLTVVAQPTAGDDSDPVEADDDDAALARFIAPAMSMLGDATSLVALAPEGKAFGSLREPLLRLLDTLAVKGMSVDDLRDPADDSASAPAGGGSDDEDDPWKGLLKPYDDTNPAGDPSSDAGANDDSVPADTATDGTDSTDTGEGNTDAGAPPADTDPTDQPGDPTADDTANPDGDSAAEPDADGDEPTKKVDDNVEGKSVVLDMADVMAELEQLRA